MGSCTSPVGTAARGCSAAPGHPSRAGEAEHVVALQLMPCRSCPYPKGAQSCSQGRAGDTDRPAVKVSRGATRGGKNMDTVTL